MDDYPPFPGFRPAAFDFLKQLAANNDRDWFKANKKAYDAAKKNIESVVSEVISGLVQYEPDFSSMEAKKAIFRIFRGILQRHADHPRWHHGGNGMLVYHLTDRILQQHHKLVEGFNLSLQLNAIDKKY